MKTMDSVIRTECQRGGKSTRMVINNNRRSMRMLSISLDEDGGDKDVVIELTPGNGTLYINTMPLSDLQRRLMIEFFCL